MKKLLLVDDDVHVRKILAIGMRLEGYEVIQAENGYQALEELDQVQVDAIVVDLIMPVMDGQAFLERAREVVGDAMPILVLTSVCKDSATVEVKKRGATDLLQKPVLAPALAAKLVELSR